MRIMFLSISLLCTERKAVTFRNKYGIFHGPNLALTFFTLPSSALAQKKEMKKNGGRRRERERKGQKGFFLPFLLVPAGPRRSRRGTPSQESGLRDSPNMKPFFDWKYPPFLSYGIYSRFNIVDQHHSIWSIYRTKQWGPFPPQPPCWVGMGQGRRGGKKKKEERGGGERVQPVTRRKSRDETRSRRQVTRRDETRDGLVLSVSRPKVTRRDDIRDQYINTFWQNSKTSFFAFLRGLFWAETKNIFRDRLARQTHEMRRDRDGLVSSRLDFFRDETVSLPALGKG